ncbi:hypothetical protein M3202_13600 [Alkalihalobacillus oceani]|uniref:Uncharacterized protein n=1 Tax=Halalkalibacter oceani TaxID=1653776 RepID=A0A9X2IQZ9_9BACI|nr:hypothetical protein [Halalkalibacter oceani]MCM3715118.1 hypothetical protein [Halalkalibacter oceani]
MNMGRMKKNLLLILIVASQLFFAASLFIGVVMWGFSGKVLSVFFCLLIVYLVAIVLASVKSWNGFKKKEHRRSLLWLLLPYAWFGILYLFLFV